MIYNSDEMNTSAIRHVALRLSLGKNSLPALVAAGVLVADQVSKGLIRALLEQGHSVPATGIFRLTHVVNTGSAFGLFPNQTFVLIGASLVALAALVYYYRKHLPSDRWTRAIMGLMLGGAIGNLLDRVVQGKVTDFIDVKLWPGYHWPAFNLADSAIVVGFILLFWRLALHRERQGFRTHDGEASSGSGQGG